MIARPAPGPLLTVMAHPDDAELWAGGTIARYTARGIPTIIAVPEHHDPVRNREAAAGAAILGATLYQYDATAPDALAVLLRGTKPEIVITHPLRDMHADHRHLAEKLLAAVPDVVIATGRPHRVYTCDTYNSLTLDGPVPAHTTLDVTDTQPVKMRALTAHRSQPVDTHFARMAATLSRLWGARIGTSYAENFVPVPVLGRLPAASGL
ncbi:1D-myo-inositol 2-acetamido-2-deoxy-alpha-D-glucopyranoside deacetylase [Actinoalloteichus hoggarensis]|uniref:1D-myo-inositol 2-acetamido-2-deoxy-alpha-D-glucopyranoside deacetylase n=2 Tax=Actinoalloteichus hoggarensis TaxID=1470176 RepID=A0A221W8A0_9PSEU|nr:1D-myo-inositol 2-acetamido-2-deoxy-alpha-D-glucopyranoside deacetylase [Actinoalloteichus hoggarensis]